MITGEQLRRARERRGWTQEQLAEAVGVTFRSIGNWERGEVPASREARLRDVLGDDLTPGLNPLAQASDLALISELARRLEGRAEQGGRDDLADHEQKSTKASVTPINHKRDRMDADALPADTAADDGSDSDGE